MHNVHQAKQSAGEQQKLHLIEYQQLLQDLECWVTETYSQITSDISLSSSSEIQEQILNNQVCTLVQMICQIFSHRNAKILCLSANLFLLQGPIFDKIRFIYIGKKVVYFHVCHIIRLFTNGLIIYYQLIIIQVLMKQKKIIQYDPNVGILYFTLQDKTFFFIIYVSFNFVSSHNLRCVIPSSKNYITLTLAIKFQD